MHPHPSALGATLDALKKSPKVLAALVDAQIQIDKQKGIHTIKHAADSNKQFICNTPYPKGSPTQMPAITQDYNNNDTLESKISYLDDQWEEEAVEVLP